MKYKELQNSTLSNNDKHQEVNKFIESDYKYFAVYSKESDLKLNQIRNETKNVEIQLKQRNKLIEKELQKSKSIQIELVKKPKTFLNSPKTALVK